MLKEFARELVPQRTRFLLKRFALSLFDPIFPKARKGGGAIAPPPRSLNFAGDGDFSEIGEEFFGYFKAHGQITPSASVLDVGCGVGRMALPLTRYLNESGRYEGFDIVPEGIRWCNDNIAARFPNFNFRLIDLYNGNYNPRGAVRPAEFRFPYAGESFDFVFLTSVFTHLLPDDLSNYSAEISRVLRSGGRALITMFLLNERSVADIAAGRSSIDFRYSGNGYRTRCKNFPEDAVAYDESWIIERLAGCGLKLAEPIMYGRWSGSAGVSYQDILMLSKVG